MVRSNAERGRGFSLELFLDCKNGLSRRQSGAVSDAKNVRVDGKCFRAECAVHYDIGGLAANSGKLFQRIAIGGDLPAMLRDKLFREGDYIFCLGIEQADRLYMFFQSGLTERDHLLWCLDVLKQQSRRLVDPDIRRLCRQDDRNEQLIMVAEAQFGFG